MLTCAHAHLIACRVSGGELLHHWRYTGNALQCWHDHCPTRAGDLQRLSRRPVSGSDRPDSVQRYCTGMRSDQPVLCGGASRAHSSRDSQPAARAASASKEQRLFFRVPRGPNRRPLLTAADCYGLRTASRLWNAALLLQLTAAGCCLALAGCPGRSQRCRLTGPTLGLSLQVSCGNFYAEHQPQQCEWMHA